MIQVARMSINPRMGPALKFRIITMSSRQQLSGMSGASPIRVNSTCQFAMIIDTMSCQQSHRRVHGRCRHPGCWVALCIFAALLVSTSSKAEGLEAAEAAYADGRYLEAAEIANNIGGASGLVFAARSLDKHTRFFAEDSKRKELYERSMDMAKSAIELDPENPKAHLGLASAMGEYALVVGRIKALNEKLAGRIREHLDIALSLDEDSAWVHSALGQWHAGLIGEMGSFLARSVFGAKRQDAVFHLNRALELDPQDIYINYGSAKGFLALGKRKYRDRAQALLRRALNLPAVDAYETVVHQEIQEFMALLNKTEELIHDR